MAMHMGRCARALVSISVAMALGIVLLAAPAAAADPGACIVKNTDSGATRPTLQKGVWNAKSGQHLTVRGVCYGVTTIAKDLTITGIVKDGSGKPILDGQQAGSVVTVTSGAEVVIRDLTVRNGKTVGWGGGIFVPAGSLTLNDVLVRANSAIDGGGIDVEPGGSLTLNGSTRIRGNTASANGGGIWWNGVAVVINGSSAVKGNQAGSNGGGLMGFGGSLTMRASSAVSGNTAAVAGGGLAHQDSTFDAALCGTRIRDNQPNDCSAVSLAAAGAH